MGVELLDLLVSFVFHLNFSIVGLTKNPSSSTRFDFWEEFITIQRIVRVKFERVP